MKCLQSHLRFHFQHYAQQMPRDIKQYHYNMCPDHGTPEPLSLAIFYNQMFRTNSDENTPPKNCTSQV